jgi:hypothetical protein
LAGEFDGWGFALGHVAGARSWKVKPDGTLTGVFHERPWEQGVNTADCRQVIGHIIPGIGVAESIEPVWETDEGGLHRCVGWSWEIDGVFGIYQGFPEKLYKSVLDADHDASDCKHGFYAYQVGTLDWGNALNVSGIIHASGKIAFGPRGFRAEKAKIVALFQPVTAERIREEDYKSSQYVSVREAFDRAARKSAVSDDVFERISWRYPSIPIYNDIDQMLADFPVDEPRKEAA